MEKTKTLVLGIDGLWPELVEKYAREGAIPNIAKLIEKGVFLRMFPLPPCDTPTNWISLVTGATPGKHGALGFNVHLPGYPLDRVLVPDTRIVEAEFIWDVAERKGLLCILVNWPFSWPPTLKKGITIAGTGPGDPRWRIEYGCVYTTHPQDPREVGIKLVRAGNWKNVPESYSPPLEAVLPLRLTRSAFVWTESGWESVATEVREATPMSMRYRERLELVSADTSKGYYALVLDFTRQGYDTVIVAKQKDARKAVAILKREKPWSDWISDVFDFKVVAKYHGSEIDESLPPGPLKGVFKLKLVELSANGDKLTIFRTDIFRTDGWISPENMASEVVENIGPYCEGLELIPIITLTRNDWNTYFELLREQANWFAKAYKYFSKKYEWNLFFMQLHIFDALNHFLLRKLCPESPDYSEEEAKRVWKIYEEALRITDDLVGKLLDLSGEDTNIVVVSDHGALPTWKLVWPGTVLMERGLLQFKEVNGKLEIDWEHTKAFPWVMDIWVNLKDRFPHGIVDEDEYEKVVEEVVDALYSLHDPETGKRVFATVVVTKKEGVFFGLSGKYVADIYYFFNPPYTDIDVHRHKILELPLREIKKLSVIQYSKTIAAHDHYLPNEKMEIFSNAAVLLMYGPNIRKASVEKPVYTIDLAPTLCFLHSIPFPAQCEGKILFEIINISEKEQKQKSGEAG